MNSHDRSKPVSDAASDADTRPVTKASHDPRVHAGVPDFLVGEGFSAEAVEALLALDLTMFQWRRMAEKGEFKGKVLAGMSETLEPAILQGLLSVAQISAGIGRGRPEAPTIGMVAEVMAVDPSRASRIVSELVTRGYVARQAVQEDARKSVLVITPKARDFLGAFTLSKWRLMAQIFDGWSGEDIADFSRLFARYVSGALATVSEPGKAE
ncbi:MarR family winged helix-turn-helix transcriptional regulator [Celeribacter neptunius]|uniref:DNA-binding transcriptional regulator, MarR family n=1 Tax=Celeribacter neptunius TaxID=588602 RepID=A0A1I3PEE4_9RHOB|nr:MarR family winged helix-turn-helix transcriptional regulator [Celeribacter neptunius]SFJ19386.1 DNA-binding transcriptional regulator, MarR family [Celeribacter neptunius]